MALVGGSVLGMTVVPLSLFWEKHFGGTRSGR